MAMQMNSRMFGDEGLKDDLVVDGRSAGRSAGRSSEFFFCEEKTVGENLSKRVGD